MKNNTFIYLIFGIVLLLALVFDLGMMSKRNSKVTIKKALWQTVFWVGLSLAFWIFIWIQKTDGLATRYISAYLMEWSLSIDNIFVFILIFSFFRINQMDQGRALLIGILLAIVLRIIFIALGIGLIERFHWLLYVFGFFLLYTGIKLFIKKEEEEYNPGESKLYQWATKIFRVTREHKPGRYFVKKKRGIYLTELSMVVLMLAATDIVFAVDSIPTVVSLVRQSANIPFTQDEIMVIYSSNIFAVLGLRSLYFLLKGAVAKFDYLQQGIAVVLVFIGLKMLVEFFNIEISIYISLMVIIVAIFGSMLFSVYVKKKETSEEDITVQ
ncbi:MAG: TerC/Alx family metal homeostasis rane protein [Chitinophagaceae bacterium]|nr:TerC/Alx family metal homeostasis rane protein [Chitinophagaceae bacterium]